MSQSGIFPANKSGFGQVPRPIGNNLSYFLNANDGDKLSVMKADGSVSLVPIVAISDNYIDDAAAAAGGIVLGGLYHTAGAVKIRLV
jgi:hypothetical protein